MDIKAYINSGNLEQYCLNPADEKLRQEVAELCLAYPEIKQELAEIELALERLAQSHAITPDARLKNRVLAALNFFDNEKLDLDHLPPTSKYSNYTEWLNAVEHLLPQEPFEDFFMHVLQQDEHIAQMLVVTKLDVPEEIHETEIESFFILKGKCACTVGNEVFTLNPGDHLEIPLHVTHDIKLLSPYVIGILQHQFS
jgi:mannose-6-phosphate isomerase-like protein (cupin superfamily)